MSDLRLVSPTHPAAAPLLAGLRNEYHRAYGSGVAAELDLYSPLEFLPPGGAFLIVEEDGATVAGGALRRLREGVGEIKRMWTSPSHRGRGHARRVLAALEQAAARRGYHTLRLETGNLQLAAIELYTSAGYAEITPYGRHFSEHPQCVCFEKRLDGGDDLAADAFDRGYVLVRKMLQHHPLDAGLGKVA
jgi:GNAT superfamily N-acetyltransferase